MFHPTVSPHDPSTVVVACDMTGSYITHDAGASWRMFNLRGVARFFVFDPSLPNVIYAQNENLWRSRDNGKTWTLVSPPPSSIQSISMASDHSDERIISNANPWARSLRWQLIQITPVICMPRPMQPNPDCLNPLTKVRSGRGFPICLSRSATCGSGRSPPKSILAIGKHFIVEGWGESSIFVFRRLRLAASASQSNTGTWTVYTVSKSGVAISTDGEKTGQFPAAREGSQVRAVASSLRHPEIAYVSYSGLQLMATLGTESLHQRLRQDLAAGLERVQDRRRECPACMATDRFGTDWVKPLDMTAGNQDPDLVYATDFGRTLVTTDGGMHWRAAYSRRAGIMAGPPRDGCDNRLWNSLRSIRSQAPVYNLYRHIPLSQ